MIEQIFGFFEAFFALMKTFKLKDFIDIISIAVVIYELIKITRETRAGGLVKGIIFLFIIYIFSFNLKLRMLSSLLNNFFQFSFIAMLIMFQPELRRVVEQLGHTGFGNYSPARADSSTVIIKKCINDVITSVSSFQVSGTGALIVFERQTKLGEIIDTGIVINAKSSVSLIGNIFFNKAPLHDGALIIRDGKIYAAGCILPLTKEKLGNNLGTRHRAALGMSENSDAILLVVSEETGVISLAINGNLKRNYTKESLKKVLEDFLLFQEEKTSNKKIFSAKYWKSKIKK